MKPRIPQRVLNRFVYLTPFNTEQEKDILLLQQLQGDSPEFCIDESLRVLGFERDNDLKIADFTLKEKKLLIYLYRSISVGDEQRVEFQCKCSRVNSQSITFNFAKGDVPEGVKFLGVYPNDDNLDDYSDGLLESLGVSTLEDLNIQEYEEIFDKIKKAQDQIDFKVLVQCSQCSAKTNIDCEDTQFVLDHISEDDLLLLYQNITALVDQGYSLKDVYQMLPFERSVLMEQMTQYLEEKHGES